MATQLTSAERITAALKGEATDHVPFCPFLAYVWEHFPKEVQDLGQPGFHRVIGADPLWRGAPCPVRAIPPPEVTVRQSQANGRTTVETVTPVGTLRHVGQYSPAGNTTFLVEHPLKEEADFRVQTWIEEHTRYEYAPQAMLDHLAGAGREGVSLGMLVPRGKSAFQSLVEHHVGTQELAYALADYPEAVETLWRTMVAKDLEAVRLALAAPYAHFITWEDSGTQNYSPTQYDRYIGAEIGQWCALLAAHGKTYVQHACGHLKALVGRMPEHGVTTVESLSPPPTGNLTLRAAREIVGARLGIIGGIEPTQFLTLSEAELGPYTEQVIADGRGGPFVLANSDSCPPGVTLAKFKLVADIARITPGAAVH